MEHGKKSSSKVANPENEADFLLTYKANTPNSYKSEKRLPIPPVIEGSIYEKYYKNH
jgi:hypothetical protein